MQSNKFTIHINSEQFYAYLEAPLSPAAVPVEVTTSAIDVFSMENMMAETGGYPTY